MTVEGERIADLLSMYRLQASQNKRLLYGIFF